MDNALDMRLSRNHSRFHLFQPQVVAELIVGASVHLGEPVGGDRVRLMEIPFKLKRSPPVGSVQCSRPVKACGYFRKDSLYYDPIDRETRWHIRCHINIILNMTLISKKQGTQPIVRYFESSTTIIVQELNAVGVKG